MFDVEGGGQLLALRGFAAAAAPDDENVLRIPQHQILDASNGAMEDVVGHVLSVDRDQFSCGVKVEEKMRYSKKQQPNVINRNKNRYLSSKYKKIIRTIFALYANKKHGMK